MGGQTSSARTRQTRLPQGAGRPAAEPHAAGRLSASDVLRPIGGRQEDAHHVPAPRTVRQRRRATAQRNDDLYHTVEPENRDHDRRQ